jgi:hypothetical protein
MTCQEALKKLLDSAVEIYKGEKVNYRGKSVWVVDPKTNEDTGGQLILIDENFYQELRAVLADQKTFADLVREKAEKEQS